MRVVWGGFCALVLFGAVQAVSLWSDKPPHKNVSHYADMSSYAAPLQAEPSVERNLPRSATSAALSSSAIVTLIIQQSRNAYYATGHPCACPDDLMRNGRRCGGSSAYSRPGGASPKCYPSDVTAEDIKNFPAQQ
jgi:hypothetical protein